MKVAMYYNNRDVRIEEMAVPEIGPKEILVKIICSGICGSDVLEWYRLQKAPIVLGHEITGVIAEIGDDVENYQIGDRVFVSHHVPCNTCHYCLNDHHTACDTLHNTNYDPGGFSEFLRVPEINVGRGVFRLPDSLSFEDGTFIEPLACVLRGQRIANIRSGQSVLILGSGLSGLLHMMLALANGASRVIMTDINAYRLKTAEALGASKTINASSGDITELLLSENNGTLADHVIVSTGAISAFEQALKCVDRGGTVLCFASPEPGVDLTVPLNDFWRMGINLVPSYGNSPDDAIAAIDLINSGKVPVGKMITHRLDLSEAQEGFRLVAEAKECIKVLLEPNECRDSIV